MWRALTKGFGVKIFRFLLAAGVGSLAALGGWASAHAAGMTVGGNVQVNVTGFFLFPVTKGATVACSGTVALAPANTSFTVASLPLSLIIGGLGGETATQDAVIGSDGSAFTCSFYVPYRFENVDPGATQLVIAYQVRGNDPGYFAPGCSNPQNPLACYTAPQRQLGRKQQILQTLPIPPNGTTTTVAVNPKL